MKRITPEERNEALSKVFPNGPLARTDILPTIHVPRVMRAQQDRSLLPRYGHVLFPEGEEPGPLPPLYTWGPVYDLEEALDQIPLLHGGTTAYIWLTAGENSERALYVWKVGEGWHLITPMKTRPITSRKKV